MENAIDIDKIVDYRAEYSAIVQKPKVSGHTLTGLCPFHQDKNASFSVNLENGKYKCFSCGAEGNFLTFYANTRNIDTKEAYKEILEKYHISMPTPTYLGCLPSHFGRTAGTCGTTSSGISRMSCRKA